MTTTQDTDELYDLLEIDDRPCFIIDFDMLKELLDDEENSTQIE